MAAPWLLAAAWAWSALAAFAACVWERSRHRIPRGVAARIGAVSGGALVIAAILAAWGFTAPVGDPAAGGSAPAWRSFAVGVTTLHVAAASFLLGGSIYLAFGRLMGTRACAACGWQAMIGECLPEATVATAVTSLGMAILRAGPDPATLGGLGMFPELLGLVSVWLGAFVARSAWMIRQPAIARTALAWGMLLVVASIDWRWIVGTTGGDVVAAGWLAGCSCGVALAVLAAALHRRALLLGGRFDRPAALAEIVGGLSPLRRLAACALGGLTLFLACGVEIVLQGGGEMAAAPAGPVLCAVAVPWLLVTWGAAAIRDRLGPACSPSITGATIVWLLGLSAIWAGGMGGTAPASTAAGVALVLASVGLVALCIGWCARAVGSHLRPVA